MKKLINIIFVILLVTSCKSSKSFKVKGPIRDLDVVNATKSDEKNGLSDDVFETSNESVVVSSIYMGSDIEPSATAPQGLKIININNSRESKSVTNQGNLVYKIPSEMSVRNTYQIMVRISKSTLNIYENLNGEVRTSIIPITETMEVKLIDPSPSDAKMFDIITDNTAIQIVENNEEITQWSWNVTPLKKGSANLKIVISIIRDGKVKEIVYEDTVKVKMDMSKEIPFFFGKYWQWLLSTLVIPFGIWLYNKKKKQTT